MMETVLPEIAVAALLRTDRPGGEGQAWRHKWKDKVTPN